MPPLLWRVRHRPVPRSSVSVPTPPGSKRWWKEIQREVLEIRAKGEQPAIAVLHDKLAHLPRRVGESAGEFHAASGILGVKRVRILDIYVSIEQFVRVLVGVRCGLLRAAEVNGVPVAGDDCVDRRVLPRAQTF